jgi:GxxExxY protein
MISPVNKISEAVIGAAIEVHKHLGPGLLESAYQECLACELTFRNIGYEKEKGLPVFYKNNRIDCAYRLDFVIGNNLVIEVKSVERILPIHRAQILSYLKLSGIKFGLLINFNVKLLVDGIERYAN